MTNIRRADIHDLDSLVTLFDAYRTWYRKESNLEQARLFLSDRINKEESIIFVATIENKVVGFTQLYPLFSSTRMKRLWLLNDLFISPEARGKGLSKQLLMASQNLCRETGACAVSLETEISNTIGNNLYPKMGFELNETHNFYEWSNDTN